MSADIKTCVFSWEANGQVGESDNISVVPGLVRSGDGDERTLTPTAPWQRGAGGGLLPQIRFNHSSAGTKTCVFSVEADGQVGEADNILVVPGLVRSGDDDARTLTPTAPWQRGAGGGLLPQIRFNHSSAGTKTCVFSVEADGQGGYADKTPTISQSR